jgi:hypothetical protein
MALGQSGKAQRILVKAKGWNPDVIEGFDTDLSNLNKAPDPWKMGDQSVGTLPEGIHDSYPGDHPSMTDNKVTWNNPNEAGRSGSARRTVNADPNPGEHGAGGEV